MCFNKKVVAALAIVALTIYLFVPNLVAAAIPLLILAACPLSMVLMMRMMSRSDEGSGCSSSRADTDDALSQLRAEVATLRAAQVDGAAPHQQPSRCTYRGRTRHTAPPPNLGASCGAPA